MLKKCFAISCLLRIAEAMIVGEPGYGPVWKTWPQFVNQSKTKVQKELSRIFPNVRIKVVNVAKDTISEEAYHEAIKVVVNDADIVIKEPKFFGSEPKLKLLKKRLGQNFLDLIRIMIRTFPTAKIVSYKHGKVIYVHKGGQEKNYIRLEVEPNGMVLKMPRYIRVLPSGKKV